MGKVLASVFTFPNRDALFSFCPLSGFFTPVPVPGLRNHVVSDVRASDSMIMVRCGSLPLGLGDFDKQLRERDEVQYLSPSETILSLKSQCRLVEGRDDDSILHVEQDPETYDVRVTVKAAHLAELSQDLLTFVFPGDDCFRESPTCRCTFERVDKRNS